MHIKFLLSVIECPNAEFQAVIVLICKDDGDDGKMNNLEAADVYLIPAEPLGNKRGTAEISSMEVSNAKKGPLESWFWIIWSQALISHK